jgi:hypothetical protein
MAFERKTDGELSRRHVCGERRSAQLGYTGYTKKRVGFSGALQIAPFPGTSGELGNRFNCRTFSSNARVRYEIFIACPKQRLKGSGPNHRLTSYSMYLVSASVDTRVIEATIFCGTPVAS